jgi:hypothetical protein
MTSEKELKLSPDELVRLVWVCSACEAEQGFDISSKKQTDRLHFDQVFKCGICGVPYDSRLLKAFKLLQEFYVEIKNSPINVFFRVPINNKEEKPKI